ncbi:MAG: hypothetical protein H6681_05945 [Desulfobacteraceae bacterium]|nr:hypothetical protein [Desulfobacteraceae bacterium]
MKKNLYPIIFFIFFFILTSCSDNNSGSKNQVSDTTEISGILTDPPIEGARVFPVNKTSLKEFSAYESDGKTDVNGRFKIMVEAKSLELVSHLQSYGGTDSQTGLSFDNLRFKALFNSNLTSGIVISPVTSLIYHMVQDIGLSPEQAENKITELFSLPQQTSPSTTPLSDPSLLKASIIISYAAVLKETDQPFKEIADVLKNKSKLVESTFIDESILDEIFQNNEKTRILKNYFNLISEKNSIEEIISDSKIFFLKTCFLDGINSLVKNDDTDFESHLPNIEKNIDFISRTISDKNIRLEKNTIIQTLRYILNEYNLAEIKAENEGYSFGGVFFTGSITNENLYNSTGKFISDDENIERSSSSLFNIKHDEPVLPNEIPGNDNSKRVDYYFNSDISHLYLASKTLDYVYDDAKRDEILKQIVRGYSKSGLFDHAKLIADTYIFTPDQKCLSYFLIARSMVDYNMHEEALDLVKNGEKIFWDIVENKGYHLFDKDDVYRFFNLVIGFAKTGNYDLLNSNLEKLKINVIPEIENNFRVYSGVLSVIYSAINEMFEDNETENWEKKLLTDLLFDLSKNCPPNESRGKKYYKMKIFAMANSALFYGKLKEKDKVVEVAAEIKKIRENDGLESDIAIDGSFYLNLTGEETLVYMDDLISAYAWLGDESLYPEVESIFQSLPEDSNHFDNAVSAFAAAIAASQTTEAAIDFVKSFLNETTDDNMYEALTEALTFKSDYLPGIGKIAFDKNDFQGAKEAALLALSFADKMYNTGSDSEKSSYKIQKGYHKAFTIFSLLKENNYADICFENIKKVLDGGSISGIDYLFQLEPMNGIKYYIDSSVKSAFTAFEAGNDHYKNLFIELALEKSVEAFNSGTIDFEDKTDFLTQVMEYSGLVQRKDIISQLKDNAVFSISNISVTDDDEDQIITEAEEFIKLAEIFSDFFFMDDAKNILEMALSEINKILDQEEKTELLCSTAIGFAKANFTDRGLEVAESIEFTEEKFNAISEIALQIAAFRDDFPQTQGATIDFDKDGKPYFFSTLLTDQEISDTGLILDEDSDNDGTEDIYDPMPLFKN